MLSDLQSCQTILTIKPCSSYLNKYVINSFDFSLFYPNYKIATSMDIKRLCNFDNNSELCYMKTSLFDQQYLSFSRIELNSIYGNKIEYYDSPIIKYSDKKYADLLNLTKITHQSIKSDMLCKFVVMISGLIPENLTVTKKHINQIFTSLYTDEINTGSGCGNFSSVLYKHCGLEFKIIHCPSLNYIQRKRATRHTSFLKLYVQSIDKFILFDNMYQYNKDFKFFRSLSTVSKIFKSKMWFKTLIIIESNSKIHYPLKSRKNYTHSLRTTLNNEKFWMFNIIENFYTNFISRTIKQHELDTEQQHKNVDAILEKNFILFEQEAMITTIHSLFFIKRYFNLQQQHKKCYNLSINFSTNTWVNKLLNIPYIKNQSDETLILLANFFKGAKNKQNTIRTYIKIIGAIINSVNTEANITYKNIENILFLTKITSVTANPSIASMKVYQTYNNILSVRKKNKTSPKKKDLKIYNRISIGFLKNNFQYISSLYGLYLKNYPIFQNYLNYYNTILLIINREIQTSIITNAFRIDQIYNKNSYQEQYYKNKYIWRDFLRNDKKNQLLEKSFINNTYFKFPFRYYPKRTFECQLLTYFTFDYKKTYIRNLNEYINKYPLLNHTRSYNQLYDGLYTTVKTQDSLKTGIQTRTGTINQEYYKDTERQSRAYIQSLDKKKIYNFKIDQNIDEFTNFQKNDTWKIVESFVEQILTTKQYKQNQLNSTQLKKYTTHSKYFINSNNEITTNFLEIQDQTLLNEALIIDEYTNFQKLNVYQKIQNFIIETKSNNISNYRIEEKTNRSIFTYYKNIYIEYTLRQNSILSQINDLSYAQIHNNNTILNERASMGSLSNGQNNLKQLFKIDNTQQVQNTQNINQPHQPLIDNSYDDYELGKYYPMTQLYRFYFELNDIALEQCELKQHQNLDTRFMTKLHLEKTSNPFINPQTFINRSARMNRITTNLQDVTEFENFKIFDLIINDTIDQQRKNHFIEFSTYFSEMNNILEYFKTVSSSGNTRLIEQHANRDEYSVKETIMESCLRHSNFMINLSNDEGEQRLEEKRINKNKDIDNLKKREVDLELKYLNKQYDSKHKSIKKFYSEMTQHEEDVTYNYREAFSLLRYNQMETLKVLNYFAWQKESKLLAKLNSNTSFTNTNMTVNSIDNIDSFNHRLDNFVLLLFKDSKNIETSFANYSDDLSLSTQSPIQGLDIIDSFIIQSSHTPFSNIPVEINLTVDNIEGISLDWSMSFSSWKRISRDISSSITMEINSAFDDNSVLVCLAQNTFFARPMGINYSIGTAISWLCFPHQSKTSVGIKYNEANNFLNLIDYNMELYRQIIFTSTKMTKNIQNGSISSEFNILNLSNLVFTTTINFSKLDDPYTQFSWDGYFHVGKSDQKTEYWGFNVDDEEFIIFYIADKTRGFIIPAIMIFDFLSFITSHNISLYQKNYKSITTHPTHQSTFMTFLHRYENYFQFMLKRKTYAVKLTQSLVFDLEVNSELRYRSMIKNIQKKTKISKDNNDKVIENTSTIKKNSYFIGKIQGAVLFILNNFTHKLSELKEPGKFYIRRIRMWYGTVWYRLLKPLKISEVNNLKNNIPPRIDTTPLRLIEIEYS